MTESGLLRRLLLAIDGSYGRANGKSSESGWRSPRVNVCAATSASRSIRRRAWAWHDHSPGSRRAQWRGLCDLCRKLAASVFRITKGEAAIARFEDKLTKTVRSFARAAARRCLRTRAFAAHGQHPARAVSPAAPAASRSIISRSRSCRSGPIPAEPLVPLKGFPGVVWQRSKKNKRLDHEGMF